MVELSQVSLAVTAPLVLMQPTTLCNLDCSYCYIPDRAKARVMSVEVADAVADAVMAWSQDHPVRVLWHGGEPLATGLAHFATLVGRFGTGRGHRVRHGVQTNATLIDDRWCELFATVPIEVAVSIDGPAAENLARADRGGRDSTERTLRGIELLRRHEIPFGAIAVSPTPLRPVRWRCMTGSPSWVRPVWGSTSKNAKASTGTSRTPAPRWPSSGLRSRSAGRWIGITRGAGGAPPRARDPGGLAQHRRSMAWGVLIAVLALVPTAPALVPITAGIAVIGPVLAVVAQTRRALLIPRHLLGRVASVGPVISGSTAPLGSLLTGFLLAWVGGPATCAVLGCGLLIIAATATTSPAMRHADLPTVPDG